MFTDDPLTGLASAFSFRARAKCGVRLPGGVVIVEDEAVTGTGALGSTAPLTAERSGWWDHAIGYCAPDATEVVVFDSARRANE